MATYINQFKRATGERPAAVAKRKIAVQIKTSTAGSTPPPTTGQLWPRAKK